MAPARPVWAGVQGQTLQPVVAALAQGLDPAWSQSPLGGVCRFSVSMVSIQRDECFKKFASGVDAFMTSKNFCERCFVHYNKNKQKKKLLKI